MKKFSIISILLGCFTLGMTTTSCEDMLTPDSEHHSYVVAQDTLYSYWGIVRSLQNVAERYIVLGECRGDLVSGTGYVSDSISAILNFDMSKAEDGSCRFLRASDYYHVINSCNAYLADCDRARVTGTLQPYMLKEAAQVEAIRAWVYLQLVQVYGEVPFYTEPLLTTDDINAFMRHHETVNAGNLADKLSGYLTAALEIELQYGLPQYGTYGTMLGYSFHSSKAMIPLNLILGDLYLTKGDVASCEIAARYYYNYLTNNKGMGRMTPGGVTPCGNYAYGYKGDGFDQPRYLYSGVLIWDERGAVSSTGESITSIPSAWNKLDGTVLRGVNALYGFDSEISVRTAEGDTVSSAAINIYPKSETRQLGASKAYNNLCKAQTFEIYIGDGSATDPLRQDPEVGDARQVWVDEYGSDVNGKIIREKYITKINPYGYFSSVAHVIYRKSMVWLRYAEALNRAGYPSYAFAILKNGLCNNTSWIPNLAKHYTAVKDTAYYLVTPEGKTIPEDYLNSEPTNKVAFEAYLQKLVEDGELESTEGEIKWEALSYANYPDPATCDAVVDYLDRREVSTAPDYLALNVTTLRSPNQTQFYKYRTVLTERSMPHTDIYPASPVPEGFTVGIHAHGCGLVKFDERNSSFNYVDVIIKKAKENYGVTLTKEQIYDGSNDDVVKDCVEDLIVDEEALELAFEGNRFFDLMRVADRRNEPSYLAERVARRNSTDGTTPDASLYSKLLNRKNWFFPLPVR